MVTPLKYHVEYGLCVGEVGLLELLVDDFREELNLENKRILVEFRGSF